MSLTEQTLRLATQGKVVLGSQVDAATRDLVRAWVRMWNSVQAEMEAAALDMATDQLTEAGKVARLRLNFRARQALAMAQAALERLAAGTEIRISGMLPELVTHGGVTEARVLQSQLPRRAVRLVTGFDRVPHAAVEAMVQRSVEQITAATLPLGAEAAEAMRQALVSGIPLGRGPRETARVMVRNAEGAFNGGLARALRIARTETMDAYRSGALATRVLNEHLVEAVEWRTALDTRVCTACISMAGQRFPADMFGPNGHVNCRCIFTPVLVPWRELGIPLDEPPSVPQDGRGWFDTQPEDVQKKIMGPGRWAAYQSGQVGWDDMTRWRQNPDWRTSIELVPLKELIRTGSQVA